MAWVSAAGVSAIEGLRQVLDQLATFTPSGAPHGGLGTPTLTPTFIETRPRATHTVQGEAVLTLDRPVAPVLAALARRGIAGGLELAAYYPQLGHAWLVCATETRTAEDIERYRAALSELLQPARAA